MKKSKKSLIIKPTPEQIKAIQNEKLSNGLCDVIGAPNPNQFGGNNIPLPGPGSGQFGSSQPIESVDTLYANLRWYLVSNQRQVLSQCFAEIGLIQTICRIPVEDGLRGGVLIKSDQLSEDEIKELHVSIDRDDDLATVGWAETWNRLYGGAGVLVLVDDQDPETPFEIESVGPDTDLEFRDVDMWELFWDKQNTEGYDAQTQTHEFEWYSYYSEHVHKTRVMKLTGLKAPSFIRPRLRGWGVSVVETLIRSINQYLKSTDLAFEVLDEFKIDVYKIKNLVTLLLQPGGTNAVKARIQMANWQKNYQNAVVMDSEDDWDHKQLSFAGLADAMSEIRMQVASDMRMPITKLFGTSASKGFQTDENDMENYNSMVESEVRSKLKYHILRILEIKCQKLFGFIPDDLEIEFKPLRELSALDQETVKTQKFTRLLQAQQAGLISPEQFQDAANKGNLFDVSLDYIGDGLPTPEDTASEEDEDSNEPGADKENTSKVSLSHGPQKGVQKKNSRWPLKNWEESKHPREDDGKFGTGGGGAEKVKLKDVHKQLMGMHTEGAMKRWLEDPESSSAPEEICVIKHEGKIVGWSGVGKIRIDRVPQNQLSVYVDKSMRGRGMGKQLVKDAILKIDEDEAIYFDPDAPQLGEWIEEQGRDAIEIPEKYLDK